MVSVQILSTNSTLLAYRHMLADANGARGLSGRLFLLWSEVLHFQGTAWLHFGLVRECAVTYLCV